MIVLLLDFKAPRHAGSKAVLGKFSQTFLRAYVSAARFGKSELQEIFRRGEVEKPQEYFVYFKALRRCPGGKDPQSAADDIAGR